MHLGEENGSNSTGGSGPDSNNAEDNVVEVTNRDVKWEISRSHLNAGRVRDDVENRVSKSERAR